MRTSRAASGERGAFVDALLYESLDFCPLLLRDKRPDLDTFVARIPDANGIRYLGCDRCRLVHAITGHQHARRRIAGLPRVVETLLGASPDGLVEVSVVEQDVRGLAAQFLCYPLDRRCSILSDRDACARRARKGHHRDVGVLREGGTDSWTVAVDEIEHAGRHAR